MASGCSDGVVRTIISRAMKDERIHPDDIPEDLDVDPSDVQQVLKSNRYFTCKAFASFNTHNDPSGRGHTKSWKSAHAWCTIDLKGQRIAHRWIQKCNKCEGESEPWFDEQALENMAKRAVKLYLINIGRIKKRKKGDDDDDDDNPQIGPPHEETRCAMCQQLGRSCWKKYKHVNRADYQDEDDLIQHSYDDYYDDGDENDPDSYYDDHDADEDDQCYDQYYDDRYDEYDYDPYDYEDTYNYDDNDDANNTCILM